MKPNIFIYYPDCPEDFFSRSLAYITNLFPVIGQKLVQRIAVLSGNVPDYFGKFQQCEFIGYEFQGGHRDSKPDLKILCSNSTLYFENKLESPLNLDQMERHTKLILQQQNGYLLFVSNILQKNDHLKSLPGYLHPVNADHYLWLDFLPIFQGDYRRNSLPDLILSDFNSALKNSGMIGRQIEGAAGSIYTYNSDASHLALKQLWGLLQELDFKLVKKANHETTIRAYPVKQKQYPLLNPRFNPTAAWLDAAWDKECLDFTVLSKGDDLLDRKLAHFNSTKECTYIASPFTSGDGYYYHGHFLFPLIFSGNPVKINFQVLKEPLVRMLNFLRD